jgi:condensin complex subunit 2
LAEVYPEKKWKDISVAFCFICLLHLANENELIIQHPVQQEIASDLVIQREHD